MIIVGKLKDWHPKMRQKDQEQRAKIPRQKNKDKRTKTDLLMVSATSIQFITRN